MTKADIINKLHQQTGQAKKVCADQVEAILELIKDTLANGEQVKIAMVSGMSMFNEFKS